MSLIIGSFPIISRLDDVEDAVGILFIIVIINDILDALSVENHLMVETPVQVLIAKHELVALEVEGEPEAAGYAVVLEQVVDADHHEGVDAGVEIDGRGAAGELLVSGVQEAEIGLRNQFVDGILGVVVAGGVAFGRGGVVHGSAIIRLASGGIGHF